jgi:hypothetical protein
MTQPLFDDPATQHFIRQGIAHLHDEFRGIFFGTDHPRLRR